MPIACPYGTQRGKPTLHPHIKWVTHGSHVGKPISTHINSHVHHTLGPNGQAHTATTWDNSHGTHVGKPTLTPIYPHLCNPIYITHGAQMGKPTLHPHMCPMHNQHWTQLGKPTSHPCMGNPQISKIGPKWANPRVG